MEAFITIAKQKSNESGYRKILDGEGRVFTIHPEKSIPELTVGEKYKLIYSEVSKEGQLTRWVNRAYHESEAKKSYSGPSRGASRYTPEQIKSFEAREAKKNEQIARISAANNAVALTVAFCNALVAKKEADKLTGKELVAILDEERKRWQDQILSEILKSAVAEKPSAEVKPASDDFGDAQEDEIPF